MNLIFPADAILNFASTYLGKDYTDTFRCTEFIKEVYARFGLTLPPSTKNVDREHLVEAYRGYVVYLRHKESPRRVTHAGLLYSASELIHCTHFLGRKVVITPLSKVFVIYELSV